MNREHLRQGVERTPHCHTTTDMVRVYQMAFPLRSEDAAWAEWIPGHSGRANVRLRETAWRRLWVRSQLVQEISIATTLEPAEKLVFCPNVALQAFVMGDNEYRRQPHPRVFVLSAKILYAVARDRSKVSSMKRAVAQTWAWRIPNIRVGIEQEYRNGSADYQKVTTVNTCTTPYCAPHPELYREDSLRKAFMATCFFNKPIPREFYYGDPPETYFQTWKQELERILEQPAEPPVPQAEVPMVPSTVSTGALTWRIHPPFTPPQQDLSNANLSPGIVSSFSSWRGAPLRAQVRPNAEEIREPDMDLDLSDLLTDPYEEYARDSL